MNIGGYYCGIICVSIMFNTYNLRHLQICMFVQDCNVFAGENIVYYCTYGQINSLIDGYIINVNNAKKQ